MSKSQFHINLMEGISYEAMSMAGHMKLGKLIVLYDSNDISLDGSLNLSFSEDIQKRVESANWQYLRVEDGNNVADITEAIALANKLRINRLLLKSERLSAMEVQSLLEPIRHMGTRSE